MRLKFKLGKGIVLFFVYFAVFWIFMDLLPGVFFKGGIVSKLLAAAGFLVIYALGPFLMKFFKLHYSLVAKFLVNTVLTAAYLWACDKYFPDIIKLGPTYIGNTDLIIFKIPTLLTITDIYFVYFFCAIFLVFCCIIMERSIKRY
jgi:hypothetical protein